MKKYLFLIVALIGVAVASNAQVKTMKSTVYSTNTTDTVTNTGTKSLITAVMGPGYGNVTTVAFTATKISGTGAGTATLQGSLDGTNWYTASGTSAYTITDVTSQTQVFRTVNGGDAYYRILVVGSGTESLKIEAKYLVRQ